MLVKVYNNDINTALRKLKKKLLNEKVLIDYIAAQRYEKPSVKRRRRHKEAILRHKREQAERLAEL